MPEIDSWIAENYDDLVADSATHWSYTSVAEFAEKNGSAQLAAWARGKASAAGENVAPVAAVIGEKSVRSEK